MADQQSDGSDGSPGSGSGDDPNATPLLRLPDEIRSEFKDPLGALYTDTETLLSAVDAFAETADEPDTGSHSDTHGPQLVAVGDVVTAHLLKAGRRPDLAIVDGKTERGDAPEPVLAAIDAAAEEQRQSTVSNPPATLTAELFGAIRDGIDAADPAIVRVDGEEDLAALPAVLAVPTGSSVVYGQPGEGMVHVTVDEEVQRGVRRLISRFEGDVDGALQLIGPDSASR